MSKPLYTLCKNSSRLHRFSLNILQKQSNYVHDTVVPTFLASQTSCRVCTFLSKPQTRSKSSVTKSKLKMNDHSFQEDIADFTGDTQTVSVVENEGWLTIGQYNVFPWSISGLETVTVIKSEDVLVGFDMGSAVKESIKVKDIFITHGHMDHVGAVASHASKRGLFGMKPGRYFVPAHMVDDLKQVTQAFHRLSRTTESLADVNVLPIDDGEAIRLNQRHFVRCFPTQHRIPSQGYIVYREERKLKPELHGLKGFEVAAMHREGRVIHDIIITPEIAYTGDTTFEVFLNPPTPDLLKVKLLITECTFIDDEIGKKTVEKARDYGHIHLSEFCQAPELFSDVGHIVLMHFSNKYSPNQVRQTLQHSLPPALRSKVTPALVAKVTKPSSS